MGIDGSTTSWRALSMAVGIAQEYNARITACFVFHVPATASIAALPVPSSAFVEATGSGDVGASADFGASGDLGWEVVSELRQAGVEGNFACLTGEVACELEGLAESCHADLIVVGRSRHPALHLGGVPRKLLAMGHRPVLVVP